MILINQNHGNTRRIVQKSERTGAELPDFPYTVLLFSRTPLQKPVRINMSSAPPPSSSLSLVPEGVLVHPDLHYTPSRMLLHFEGGRCVAQPQEEFAKGRRGAARMTRKACCVVPAASVAARGKQRGQLGSRKGRRKAPSPTSTLLSVLSAAAQGVSRARKSAPGVGVDRRRKNAKRHRGSSLDLIAQAAERFPVGGGFK